MKINTNKRKVMVVTIAKDTRIVKLEMDNNIIEQVKQFKYLRSMLTNDGRRSVEIRQRITIAKREFTQKYSCLQTKNLNIKTRKHFFKC